MHNVYLYVHKCCIHFLYMCGNRCISTSAWQVSPDFSEYMEQLGSPSSVFGANLLLSRCNFSTTSSTLILCMIHDVRYNT